MRMIPSRSASNTWKVAVLLLVCTGRTACGQSYIFHRLGVPDEIASRAFSINNSRTIIADILDGYGERYTGQFNAGGTVNRIGDLDYSGALSYSINNSGSVVGSIYPIGNLYGSPEALVYKDGTYSSIGKLSGAFSTAFAINDSGLVVGSANLLPNQDDHAILSANGVATDLGTLGGRFSKALGINNHGAIVGVSDTKQFVGSTFLPFIYQNGMMTAVSTPGRYWRTQVATLGWRTRRKQP